MRCSRKPVSDPRDELLKRKRKGLDGWHCKSRPPTLAPDFLNAIQHLAARCPRAPPGLKLFGPDPPFS